MRRIARLAALIALLALLPALARAEGFAVVRGGRLNLRQQAAKSSKSLGLYGTGSWVYWEGYAVGDSWYLVSTMDGRRGYMDASYLTFPSSTGTATATVTTRNGGKVNVRSGPSSGYRSVGTLATGTRVSVLLKGNNWYYISGGGLTGFMSTSYLSTGVTGGGTGGTTASQTAYVNNPRSTQVLNLRESPSQEARSIGQYRNGTQVKVVVYGSVWCEVYVGTRHGYMMTRYLSFSSVPPVSSGTDGGGSWPGGTLQAAYVNNPRSTQVLNLREAPSQDARSLGQYRNGTQVQVAVYGSVWCEVYVGALHGYMMTQYLSFTGAYTQYATPQPTATPWPQYPQYPQYPSFPQQQLPPLPGETTPTPQPTATPAQQYPLSPSITSDPSISVMPLYPPLG